MLLPRTPGFQISMLVIFRMASCANASTLRFEGKRPAPCVGKCSNNISVYRRISRRFAYTCPKNLHTTHSKNDVCDNPRKQNYSDLSVSLFSCGWVRAATEIFWRTFSQSLSRSSPPHLGDSLTKVALDGLWPPGMENP